MHNITWVRRLPWAGLTYGARARCELVATTPTGERLYIQYPGKESARADEGCRPFDFYPLVVSSQGTQGKDLGFNDIFGSVFDALMAAKNTSPDHIRVLAALTYRMAFMLDHVLKALPPRPSVELKADSHGHWQSEPAAEPDNGEFYVYSPDETAISVLAEVFPSIAGLSLEGFLRYCDLLAWNEDSKYYYSKVEHGKKATIGRTGRLNTLLTVVRVMGLVTGDVHLGELLGGFSYGTSAAKSDEVVRITGGIVH